jgi:hypothetical protein
MVIDTGFLSRLFGSEGSADEPNPLFDSEYYISRYSNVDTSNPYGHFCKIGIAKGFNPNEFFDTSWYLSVYPDVAEREVNPLDHYLKFGPAEGRNPSPRFSSLLYLAVYPDVARQLTNPLLHYLTIGKAERRQPIPVSVLPPSADVIKYFDEGLAAFATRLEIDGLLGHLAGWEDKFWVWTSFLRDLGAPLAFHQSLPYAESKTTSLQYEPARAGDFRPSIAAIALLNHGLTFCFSRQQAFYEMNEVDEAMVPSEYQNAFVDEKVANVEIGEEISARFWRELIFVVNKLSTEVQEPFSITENDNFCFPLLSRLEVIFPLPLSNRALFFHILHCDLRYFVEQNEVLEGAWGSLIVREKKLILKILSPQEVVLPRLRPRRRSVVV